MLLLLLACAPSASFDDLSVAPTEAVSTVLEVTWARGEATEAWVELSDGRVVYDVGEGDEVRVLIAGHPQLTEVPFTPVVELDGARVEGPLTVGETGLLPVGLPQLSLTDSGLGETVAPLLLTTFIGEQCGMIVLNRDAEVVWYHVLDDATRSPNITFDPTNGQLSTLFAARDYASDISGIRSVGLDGEVTREVRAPWGHHAMTSPEAGTWAYLAMDVRDPDDRGDVIGDAIIEVDSEGAERVVWSTWDDLSFAGRPDTGDYYEAGYDWVHGNSLRWNPERQSYLYSARWLDTVVEVSREDGAVVGIYGGPESLGFSPRDQAFIAQHSPSFTPDGTLLVFDNRHPEATQERSRVVEYSLNEGVLEHLRDFKAEPGFHVLALGDAVRLRDGNTLTSWGSVGQLVEFDDQAKEVWRAEAEIGFMLGNVKPLSSLEIDRP